MARDDIQEYKSRIRESLELSPDDENYANDGDPPDVRQAGSVDTVVCHASFLFARITTMSLSRYYLSTQTLR